MSEDPDHPASDAPQAQPDYERQLAGLKPPIPRELLAEVGEALFGVDWVRPLAMLLQNDPDTVSRWKRGKTRVTPRIAPELIDALQGRERALQALRKRLALYL